MRTLIVDDSMENIDMLMIILKGQGYDVQSACNGQEALERLRSEKYDLIISDILMPVMDGFQFCGECKKDVQLSKICFIFYTATYIDDKDEEFALSLGAQKFIRKPQEPEAFLALIKEVLEESGNEKIASIKYVEKEEKEILKLYSERLIAKLEKKNLDLKKEITLRKKTEEELRIYREHLEELVDERTTQLEAANKEMEAFSYSVSHDLRAPLRAVDGFSRILLEDHYEILNDEGKRICEVICDNAKHMGQLIDDLLAFSRLSRTGLQISRIDMKTMAKSVFFEVTTPEKRRRINFELEDLAFAYGDPPMMRQVWTNLISNAIKFSSKRNPAVISIKQNRGDNKVIYCITDNGAGFDAKYADKLFGVFQRLHSSSDFEGTGVGLAIVQRIIHRHGGQVWAEGAVDKGASFYFSLPDTKM